MPVSSNSSASGMMETATVSTVSSLTHRLSILQDSLAHKDRQLDAVLVSKDRQCQYLRTMHARNMLRQHVRAYRTKRLLMSLHLSAMEMSECLKREESRRAEHSEGSVYDSQAQPSKTTLRKLASLYRKRPMMITAELDDLLTHEIKIRFFDFLNNFQSISKENEALFTRNVALTKDMLTYKEQSESDRKKCDEAERKYNEKSELLDVTQRELDAVKKQLATLQRDDEVRRKRENAKAVQAKTQEMSQKFANKLAIDTLGGDESKESDSPTTKMSSLSINTARAKAISGYMLPSLPSPSSQSQSLAAAQASNTRSPLSRNNVCARRTTAQAALNISVDTGATPGRSEGASPRTAGSLGSPSSSSGLPSLLSPTSRTAKRATARS